MKVKIIEILAFDFMFLGLFSGVIVEGSGNHLEKNLLIHNLFPGTYLDRYESANYEWPATLDIRKATNISLVGNVIAGSERTGLNTKGLSCTDTDTTEWRDNIIHSAFTGIIMTFAPEMDCHDDSCTLVTGFTIYKAFAFGIYTQISCSIHLKDMIFADNTVSIMPLFLYPDSFEHGVAHKNLTVEGGLIVGLSPHFDCERDVLNDHDREHLSPGKTGMGWCIEQPLGWSGEGEIPRSGRVGIGFPVVLAKDNMMPEKTFTFAKFQSALYGNAYITGEWFE